MPMQSGVVDTGQAAARAVRDPSPRLSGRFAPAAASPYSYIK